MYIVFRERFCESYKIVGGNRRRDNDIYNYIPCISAGLKRAINYFHISRRGTLLSVLLCASK